MDFSNQFTKIETDDSLMETVSHGDEAYPFSYYYENLALFDFNCIDWHWHNEFEFVFIESGDVFCDIGATHFILHAGQGIMINSKVLHKLESEGDVIIPNFLFKPSFIAPTESLIYEKYVSPILSSSMEYVIFQKDIAWQSVALDIIKNIIKLQYASDNREISVSINVQQLWLLLLENLSFESFEDQTTINSRARLQLMMQYIHAHFAESISLEDIANSVAISKSSALHLFQSGIKMTPINYLISYRLRQAALLLTGTEKKIASIALESGFNSVDHFCRTFKNTYGITPTNYRKQSGSEYFSKQTPQNQ